MSEEEVMKKTLPDLLDYNLDYVIVRFPVQLFNSGAEQGAVRNEFEFVRFKNMHRFFFSDWYQSRTDGSFHWTVVSRSWKSFL